MQLTRELMENAIALYHVNKKGGEMKNDLDAVFSQDGLTVNKLLNMSASEFIKTNANEVMGTGQVGFGAEFVQETVLVGELIERLETNGSLLSGANIKQMFNKEQDYPVRGAKFRMVLSAETTDGPTSSIPSGEAKKAATAQITLTSKLMRVSVPYSDELLEDSVIAIAEYVLQSIADAYETSIHQVLINGDTDTGANTNINIINGNTSALPDGNKTDVLAADGIRKAGITAGAIDAGGNLDLSVIRSARAAMGVKGLNPANLRIVPDTQTYFELLNLTEAETMEKFGDAATVKNWVLTAIDGIQIVNREEMGRATATGEIATTGNTFGQIAIVHVPSIYVGIRRGLTTELSRYGVQGSTVVTGSARVAVTLENVQNNAGATTPAALIVNI